MERENKRKQAGAELGQAQLPLEMGFTLIKVCELYWWLQTTITYHWAQEVCALGYFHLLAY